MLYEVVRVDSERWGGTFGVLLLVAIILSFPRRYELGPSWEETAFLVALLVVFLVSVIDQSRARLRAV